MTTEYSQPGKGAIAYPNVDDLVSGHPVDFDRLRNTLVLGTHYAPSFGRHDDLNAQVAMLRQEFVGQSALKFTHALLNMLLRRGIATEVVYGHFQTLWETQADILVELLDSRWLISACDTIADQSPDPAEAQSAALISLFGNTVKLAESERLMQPPEETVTPIAPRTPLFDGMTAFMSGTGDMPANLMNRLGKSLQPHSVSGVIGRELISRCLRNETVFSRLAPRQTAHRWPPYLPPAAPALARAGDPPPVFPSPKAEGPGFILLNDTGRLGKGFHLGTTFACASIRHNLERRGFHDLGWANTRMDFDALIAGGPKPALVVLNGGDILHRGTARAEELLAICTHAKSLGCAVALINATWEANPRRMLKPLESFDLIHLRDTKSRTALSRRLDVTVTPELSIPLIRQTMGEGEYPPPKQAFGVLDSALPGKTKMLLSFAESQGAPFYVMPGDTLIRTRAEVAARQGTTWPQLLQLPDLMRVSGWVTGRFHGMIAALCAGQPVCALSSNTAKVQAFLRDADLDEACLLGRFWPRYSPERKMADITRRFEMQKDAAFVAKRTAYLDDASARIDAMFDAVAALV
jgi:hypothetical protein